MRCRTEEAFSFSRWCFFCLVINLYKIIFFFVCRCCLLLLSLLCAMLSACYCTNPPLVWIFSIVLFPMIRLETEYENLMAQPPHRIPYILLTSHHYHHRAKIYPIVCRLTRRREGRTIDECPSCFTNNNNNKKDHINE